VGVGDCAPFAWVSFRDDGDVEASLSFSGGSLGATDELEGGVVCLVLCNVVAFDVLPDITLFTRYLWCVVVLRQLATMSTWGEVVNVQDLTHKYHTSHNQKTNPPLHSAA
jgi:hypothetical protein